MARFFLGVDGGQSSTTALVADENGTVIGRAVSGPCNHVSGPEAVAKFRDVIGGAVANAWADAKITSPPSFAGACLGFSGGPADKESLTRELVATERLLVTHDGEIALAGALEGRPGIIVISGTGSFAFGKNALGQGARAGGWGYIFGDEGGAFDLVRQALRAALRFEEGWAPETSLRELLLQKTGATDVQEALHLFYTPEWPRSKIAALATIVTAAAEQNDASALAIIRDAGRHLATYAGGVFRRLSSDTVPVAAIGGTFASRPLRSAFEQAVKEMLHCPVVTPERTPAEGALVLARQLT